MAFPPTPEGQARWEELDRLAKDALHRVYEFYGNASLGTVEACDQYQYGYAAMITITPATWAEGLWKRAVGNDLDLWNATFEARLNEEPLHIICPEPGYFPRVVYVEGTLADIRRILPGTCLAVHRP